MLGQVGFRAGDGGCVEGFAEDVFLYSRRGDHFLCGVDVHSYFEELFVEKGYAGFDAPGGGGFVGAQAVG